MNASAVLTKGYENIRPRSREKNKPNQTRSGAEIPTGELLGILKPGTNFKLFAAYVIHELRYVADRWRMDYNHYGLHHKIRGQCNVD